MLSKLIILFVGVPLVELALLIEAGRLMGFWPTIALVITTGVAGAALARWQGFQVLAQIRNELAQGRIPASQLAEGFLILIAGIVLLTPGFLTDIAGLLLLMPPVRHEVRKRLVEMMASRVRQGQARIFFRG